MRTLQPEWSVTLRWFVVERRHNRQSSEEQMRAVVVRHYGGPEALEVVDVPVPEPGRGQVRIRVEAAAVNPLT